GVLREGEAGHGGDEHRQQRGTQTAALQPAGVVGGHVDPVLGGEIRRRCTGRHKQLHSYSQPHADAPGATAVITTGAYAWVCYGWITPLLPTRDDIQDRIGKQQSSSPL